VHTKFWSENLKGRVNSEVVGIDWRVIIEWIIENWDEKLWTEIIWLRLGTSGGLLCTR